MEGALSQHVGPRVCGATYQWTLTHSSLAVLQLSISRSEQRSSQPKNGDSTAIRTRRRETCPCRQGQFPAVCIFITQSQNLSKYITSQNRTRQCETTTVIVDKLYECWKETRTCPDDEAVDNPVIVEC
jgi:hypothetical protein